MESPLLRADLLTGPMNQGRFMGRPVFLADLLTVPMNLANGAPASGTARRRPFPASRAGRPALRFMESEVA